jgi:hypothetical protein
MLLPPMTARRYRLAAAAMLLMIGGLSGPSALAGPAEQPTHVAQNSGQLLFNTLDDNTQDINAEEIWRVRAASGSDEPPGSIVIDYGFERIFVKDKLDNVVEKIRGQRDLRRFTSPVGAPIYIAPDKVIGVNRPIAAQHHQNSKSIIIAREGQQQVQETRQAITDALKQ